MARYIAKASERKYRYLGKEERPLSHFGAVSDWTKFAPLPRTLEQQAEDASQLQGEEVSSSSGEGGGGGVQGGRDGVEQAQEAVSEGMEARIRRLKARKEALLRDM